MEPTVVTLMSSLFQQMCVYLVVAYALTKTPLFMPLMQVSVRLPHKVLCFVIFSAFCILGTYLGKQVDGAIANTRATGAVIGGLMGGPVVGFLIGLVGGMHRYSLGGFTDQACALSTMAEGLLAGGVHQYLFPRERSSVLLSPRLVGGVTLVAEVLQMLIILGVARPYARAAHLVFQIAVPMILTNAIGAALFMRLILDRRENMEKYSIAFSARALRIAERSVGLFLKGFDSDSCGLLARIVREETGVGAVAITDCDKLLAFTGIGEDHHLPGSRISSEHTFYAIHHNEVVYADGNEVPFHCSISKTCQLGSALIIPLRGEEGRVIGTIKLYEPRRRIFTKLNRTLGEGIARLLSTQILIGKYEEQKQLLMQSEYKLLQTQVNPHFLFNALNTIAAVIRSDPNRARALVIYLSSFLRTSLKRNSMDVCLRDELALVDAYLQIEQARLGSRLSVDYSVPENLQNIHIPTFTLQPLVENAIKYGISQMLIPGQIHIGAERLAGPEVHLYVEDNAGTFEFRKDNDVGLGMNIVERRIKIRYGEHYGLSVDCVRDVRTRVSVLIPIQESECLKR